MDFKFEPGNYYLAGREQLEGHEVLRIEYYPTHLFEDDDKKTPKEVRRTRKEQQREDKVEQDIERKMNKTALVTLWVDPAEHQIVKYTFDNVWMDFLPGAWLVRVDDIRASMTMGQPFPGVWLPRAMNIHAGITLANGSFEAAYGRTFSEYREAQVKTTIRVPKLAPQMTAPLCQLADALAGVVIESHGRRDRRLRSVRRARRGPASGDRPRGSRPRQCVADRRGSAEARGHRAERGTVGGCRHGDRAAAEGLRAGSRRSKCASAFARSTIPPTSRSSSSSTSVRASRSGAANSNPAVRPFSRLKSQLMFLPILGYADGYGFTYGARVSTVDLLGLRRAAVGAADLGRDAPRRDRVRTQLQVGPAHPRHVELRHLEAREPALRDPRAARRAERRAPNATSPTSFASGVDASQSTVSFGEIDDRTLDARRERRARHARRPRLSGQRRLARRGLERR